MFWQLKKVMISDNLSNQLSDRVINENKIIFLILPQNSTHLSQPLKVVFFKVVKSAWRDGKKQPKVAFENTNFQDYYMFLVTLM